MIQRYRNLWRAFRLDRHGNTAITFGLALLPAVGLVGAAVDYSRANSTRTQMQAALDAAGLMLSKEAAGLTSAQVTQKANDYFNTMFTRPDALNKQLSVSYEPAASSLTLSGSATVSSTIARVFGHTQIPIASSSTVTWGISKLRIALVLDNTGSMSETDASGTTKISALKTAAHQFLSLMQKSASKPGDVQVAIVPFNLFVKVDPAAYSTKTWIDWNFSTTAGSDEWGNSGTGCIDAGGASTACDATPSTWNGCFTDRTQSFDVQNTTPTPANVNTYFPAVNCSLAQIMPLTSDWTGLNARIDQMVAAGYTNQTIGLAWGWQALSLGEPLSAPSPPADTQQIIVLLTDGLNTKNRWDTNQSAIDARTLAACNNIRAAGIQLYTVLVMSGESSILQQCATKPNMYFALTASNQIITTFNQIGGNLAQLRIAK